jgi:hypothetical protein
MTIKLVAWNNLNLAVLCQKSEVSLTELNQGIERAVLLLEAPAWAPLAWRLCYILLLVSSSLQNVPPLLHGLLLIPPSYYEAPCDYIARNWLIQDNFPNSVSLINHICEVPFPMYSNMFTDLGLGCGLCLVCVCAWVSVWVCVCGCMFVCVCEGTLSNLLGHYSFSKLHITK